MPAANSVQVLYIRHGESEANLARQFSFKSCDPPLTDQGRAQADALTTALRQLGRRRLSDGSRRQAGAIGLPVISRGG